MTRLLYLFIAAAFSVFVMNTYSENPKDGLPAACESFEEETHEETAEEMLARVTGQRN